MDWDEEKWNNNTPPATYSKPWWDLLPAQRKAAKALGYNEKTWDKEGAEQDDDPLNTRVAWDDMHPVHRKNWKTLGWDKKKWDNNTPPPSQFKPWSELTPEEQQAAENLGYDEPKWNQEGKSDDQGQVESLKIRSQNELALKTRLMNLNYEEADNISEYYDYYEEVEFYLNQATPDRKFSEKELENWSTAIGLLARKRRNIAGRMAINVYQEKRDKAVRHVAGLRKSLRSQRESLVKIKNAFATAKNMEEGVKNAVTLNDYLTTLENTLSLAADPTKLQAIDSAISELVNQVDNTGDQIIKGTAKLAAYVKKREAQLEGYESKAALVNQISATVSNIRQAVSTLAFYQDKYEAGKALLSAPGG